MISRKLKSTFYRVAGPFMRINGVLYKQFKSPPKDNRNVIKVHLGPGKRNYMNGWINIDANLLSAKIDIWADLKNPLPFKDNSVDIFYSHHVIEHLPNIRFHLQSIYKCLKSDGKIRIGGPHGDNAIKKFVDNDKEWFGDFPDKRVSIGGRLENFIKMCRAALETNFPELVDEQLLSKETLDDFDYSHTIIIEAIK
jgi:predicted SAM-dependent methyltransferase